MVLYVNFARNFVFLQKNHVCFINSCILEIILYLQILCIKVYETGVPKELEVATKLPIGYNNFIILNKEKGSLI